MVEDLLSELLSGLVPQGNNALDTKKIDKNINYLLRENWFKELYENEKYRHLLYTNRKVRGYLESKRRVDKLLVDDKKRKKLRDLMESQLKD